MKKLFLFLAFSLFGFAQSAGVGQIWTLLGPTSLQSGATANGNGTNMAVGGLSSAIFAVNCSVTCSGGTTITFEGSDASTNWAALSANQVGTATIATTVVNQASGSVTFWQVPIGALVNIRARISAYSAGTITVTATASTAPYEPKTLNSNLFVGGAAMDGNSGNKSAATPRVVIATDQPNLTTALNVALAANQSVNVAQFNGVTPLMGNGVSGTGSQRVNIASDNTAFPVNAQPSPTTTGGLSLFVLEPTASDNHTVIKNGAGQVYSIVMFNNSGTVNYWRLYNAGTGFNGCNSATNLLAEGHIPASTSDAGFALDVSKGWAFSTGISICVTGAYGQTSTTSATASAISLTIGYK